MIRFRDAALRERLPDLGLRGAQVDGLLALLNLIEGDPGWQDVRQVAYLLATIRWETGHTFRPIRERRAKPEQAKLRRLQDRYWHTGYYGRGLVQLTWEGNYSKASERLTGSEMFLDDRSLLVVGPQTFLQQPDLLLQLEPSYWIAARGMREGWFTGRKLADYIRPGAETDYRNARRIINGLDRAEEIGVLAWEFERVLSWALLT